MSELLADEGTYGVVSQMSRSQDVSRQTLYSWKAKGQAAKQEPSESGLQLERAVLTLLVQGHASYRGIQACLKELLGLQVSLGTITAIVQKAGQRAQSWLVQQGLQAEVSDLARFLGVHASLMLAPGTQS